jgi:hypothetical protein
MEKEGILNTNVIGQVTLDDLISIAIEQTIIAGALVLFIGVVYSMQVLEVPRIVGW